MKKPINERVALLIEKEKSRLEAEKKVFRRRLYDTEYDYGYGNRQYFKIEKALKRREEKLEELTDFENQFKQVKRHITVSMYVIGCRECNTVFMTVKKPISDWHECPTCRNMIYIANPKEYVLSVVNDGQFWTEMVKEALK